MSCFESVTNAKRTPEIKYVKRKLKWKQKQHQPYCFHWQKCLRK